MKPAQQARRIVIERARQVATVKVLAVLGGAAAVVIVPVIVLVVLMIGIVGGSGGGGEQACGAPAGDTNVADGTVPPQYLAGVKSAAAESGLPAPVIAAQIEAESGWDPNAGSEAGARGLTQFMPDTWVHYAPPGSDPSDPQAAMKAQGAYMAELVGQAKEYKARHPEVTTDATSLALAGYNAGWGAVLSYGGIPPYRQTQTYVAKITASAKKFSTSTGTQGSPTPTPSTSTTTAPTSSTDPTGGSDPCAAAGQGSATSGRDDYPHRGGNKHQADPWAFLQTECVSFAAWRVNQAMGTPKGHWAFTNGNGPRWMGSALDWKAGWQARGWPVGKTPVVGSVVWYAPGNHAGGVGHVAIVKSVSPDGKTFVEEGYNGLPKPHDHTYYVRQRASNVPDAFLYIPGKTVPKGGNPA